MSRAAADALPSVEGPIPGDAVTTLGEFDLAPLGYLAEEWFLEGTATSWRLVEEPTDARVWEVHAASTAAFTTRLVVCRPVDPARFNGTVAVEWLNVSAGGDGSPDWFYLHRHLMREGAAWVGVSAQKAGIDGGGLFDMGGRNLKALAPDRYRRLAHPGDAFCFDMFSQAGAAVRSRGGPLGDLDPRTVLAVGESQSAVFLVTYVNAVDPVAAVFDGFLIHGRGASGARLDGERVNPLAGGWDGTDADALRKAGGASARLRQDLRVPVLTVQSETDVIFMGGIRARQSDTDRHRLWEIAGAAHFDTYGLMGSRHDDGSLLPAELADLLRPIDDVFGARLPSPINAGPQQHYVLNAAFAHLERWAAEGGLPPSALPLQTTDGDEPELVADDLGITRGGVRTPWVDAPLAVTSGLGQQGDSPSRLFGTTRPLGSAELARLYPGGREQYLSLFDHALDEAIAAGFLLQADRGEITALAAAACPLP